jgi:hypothetical protein
VNIGIEAERLEYLYGIGLLPPAAPSPEVCMSATPVVRVLPQAGHPPQEAFSGVWFHHWFAAGGGLSFSVGQTQDGTFVLRGEGVWFSVDGKGESIRWWISPGVTEPEERVRHLLTSQVIPMVMNLRGIEVLHAASVLCPRTRQAIVLVGDGGYGKSTLAAALMARGFRLVSDDAVPLRARGAEIWTSSGPPEMGLFPQARRLLRCAEEGSADKLRVVVDSRLAVAGDFPIRRIYLLRPSAGAAAPAVRQLGPQEQVVELIKAAHRMDLRDTAMLRRQMALMCRVRERVEIAALDYSPPLDAGRLRDAVLTDLSSLVE